MSVASWPEYKGTAFRAFSSPISLPWGSAESLPAVPVAASGARNHCSSLSGHRTLCCPASCVACCLGSDTDCRHSLQRPFHRFLYDGPPPESGRLLVVAVPDEPDRRVRFEFVGGCRDGEVYEGPLANPFFWKSEYGRIGARFLVPTPAAVEAMLNGERTGPILDQEYEVVENLLQDGIRHVRAEARQGRPTKRLISAGPSHAGT